MAAVPDHGMGDAQGSSSTLAKLPQDLAPQPLSPHSRYPDQHWWLQRPAASRGFSEHHLLISACVSVSVPVSREQQQEPSGVLPLRERSCCPTGPGEPGSSGGCRPRVPWALHHNWICICPAFYCMEIEL